MTQCIAYKGGYKYQLKQDYTVTIAIIPPKVVGNDYIALDIMRGSLVHDALYQLMRENLLDHLVYREQADRTENLMAFRLDFRQLGECC